MSEEQASQSYVVGELFERFVLLASHWVRFQNELKAQRRIFSNLFIYQPKRYRKKCQSISVTNQIMSSMINKGNSSFTNLKRPNSQPFPKLQHRQTRASSFIHQIMCYKCSTHPDWWPIMLPIQQEYFENLAPSESVLLGMFTLDGGTTNIHASLSSAFVNIKWQSCLIIQNDVELSTDEKTPEKANDEMRA